MKQEESDVKRKEENKKKKVKSESESPIFRWIHLFGDIYTTTSEVGSIDQWLVAHIISEHGGKGVILY